VVARIVGGEREAPVGRTTRADDGVAAFHFLRERRGMRSRCVTRKKKKKCHSL
jgi:hypothetical protein